MDHLNDIPLLAAVEDSLSLACVQRLIGDSKGRLRVHKDTGLKGNADLRERAKELARSATPYQPTLLITDLDSIPCPGALIEEWLGPVSVPEEMLFLVAVREAEAWVLADRVGFARFFKVPDNKIPRDPEGLGDPKAALLKLIEKHSPAKIKKGVIVRNGHKQGDRSPGPRYNEVLAAFVLEGIWNLGRASQASTSLARAIRRIQAFADKFAPLNPAGKPP